MKKLIVLLFVLLLCLGDANAAYLQWDAVQSQDVNAPVLGYIVYFQEVVSDASTEIYNKNVGNVTRYTLPGELNLETGKQYRFWIIVYNKDGQSGPSNTVDWLTPTWEVPVDRLPDLIINIPDNSNLNITIVNE